MSLTAAWRARLAVGRLACGSRFREVSGAPEGVVFTLTGRRPGPALPARPSAQGHVAPPVQGRDRAGAAPEGPRPTQERQRDHARGSAKPNQSLDRTGRAKVGRRVRSYPTPRAPAGQLWRSAAQAKESLPLCSASSAFLQPPAISRYLPDVRPKATVDAGDNGKRNPVAGHSESPHARRLLKGG